MRVEDFAIGLVGLIGNPRAYNAAFNICGDETPSWKEVLDCLGKILGKEVITVDVPPAFYAKEIPSRSGEILGGRSIDGINSNEKIKEVVPAFKQNISLYEGVKMTIDAYKNNNYQCGIDWRYDADCDRIIDKWVKINSNNLKRYNTGFVDYLGTASLKNRLLYWVEYHKDNLFFKDRNIWIRVLKHFLVK